MSPDVNSLAIFGKQAKVLKNRRLYLEYLEEYLEE